MLSVRKRKCSHLVYFLSKLQTKLTAYLPNTMNTNGTNNCKLLCDRFYYALRNQRFFMTCSTLLGETIEEPTLYFDDLSENPKARDIGLNGVNHETHFIKNGTSGLSISIDSMKANHYNSYTLGGRCKETNQTINHVFTLIELVNGQKSFSDIDYVIFAMFLALSMIIGVGFAAWAFMKQRKMHKDPSTTDFLLASRSMPVFPLSLSLLSSFMSAITLIGTPSEIYVFGTQYLIYALSYFISIPLSAHILMPFFYKLGITSVYEYLEMRFSLSIRRLSAVVYIIHMTLYMAMVVYTPSFALQAVTGLNMWISAVASAGICIIYTTLGGLRSAVWTDVFQVTLMFAGNIAILIQGSTREGGLFDRAWTLSERGNRIEFFNFDPNPLLRHTFWTIMIGGTVTSAFTYSVNQAQIQRALSAKSLKQAQIAYWFNVPGLMLLIVLPGLCGILIYARYQFCDPMANGEIIKRDQLLPLYVMEVLSEDIPGFPGLFIAMLFSGALSTISSGLNGLAAVVVKDFVQSLCFDRFGVSGKAQARFTRLITFCFGFLTLITILLVQSLPGILDVAIALSSALGGPIFGVFLIGIYMPFVKWQPTMIGTVISLTLTGWITVGNIIVAPQNFDILETSTEACLYDNGTFKGGEYYPEIPVDIGAMTDWERFYSISYMYYSVVGVVGTIGISLILTPIFGLEDPTRFNEGMCNSVAVRWSVALRKRFVRSKDDDDAAQPKQKPIFRIDSTPSIGGGQDALELEYVDPTPFRPPQPPQPSVEAEVGHYLTPSQLIENEDPYAEAASGETSEI